MHLGDEEESSSSKDNGNGKARARSESPSSSSTESHSSQLVDLVVEDEEAEQIERVRARKEGGLRADDADPKCFV